ncbi:MAG: glycosyltransferase family 4 protein [Candidatus Acidiferrales bacterium]
MSATAVFAVTARMKILIFTSLFPNRAQPSLGGFVYQRVAHLAARSGNQVEVIAPVPYVPSWLRSSHWGRAAQIPGEEQIGSLRVFHPRYPLLPKVSMPFHGRLMYLGSLGRALEIYRRMKFDCIDAHYIYPDAYAAILLRRRLNVPVVVSARGTDINVFPNLRLIRPMISQTLSRAAGIIAVSAALKDAMVALGAPPEKIRVIANGVDAERFHPVDRAAARRQTAIPESARAIVSVGALLPVKGHHALIDAMSSLAPKFPDLKLYIVGDGPLRGDLENSIRQRGLTDRIFLVGNKPNEELPLWYSAADVTCLASLREGMPNVVLESLACGTPVVATRVGGTPEALVSDKLGLLVATDAGAIAAGLEAALRRTWDRTAISNHARQRDWAAVAEEVENYLRSIIGREDSASS